MLAGPAAVQAVFLGARGGRIDPRTVPNYLHDADNYLVLPVGKKVRFLLTSEVKCMHFHGTEVGLTYSQGPRQQRHVDVLRRRARARMTRRKLVPLGVKARAMNDAGVARERRSSGGWRANLGKHSQ